MKVKARRRFGLALIITGLILISSAVGLVLYNLYTDSKASEGIDQILSQLTDSSEQSEQPDYIDNPDMEMPIKTIDNNDYIGKISFPRLELELPVISEWSYPNLRVAPCRYSGSVYLDNMVIAGHNYSSFFGPLRNMEIGDEVIFTDSDGNVFKYEVSDIQVLRPTAVENMITGDWDLTIFTCTIGGRTRLALRCDRLEGEAIK